MKKQIFISLWVLLNLIGAYFSLEIDLPSILPLIAIGGSVLLLLASYLLGWMGTGIVASLFYSVTMWMGEQAFEQWGYTKWASYPMYVLLILVTIVFVIFRRRFVRHEPVMWVEKLLKRIKKRPDINALHFSLGEEDIDCEYPNSK
ncbi:membrane hypothetical protein [Brevibacillus sp. IT-7CA2]|uniref:hypothetical protein n=1 Tax=Brevibacillus sp. IT-7CA2 TaxID=3026436 RepID=UPI0039E069E4